ncbi:hypothetical protein WMF37_44710 [Sorangium sp. So ce291]|uniref:hypothetical protein n=1 Tax=Sorangium sp. So ce291 TaxID=3133294 RepID=UPI003F63AD63
MQELWTDAGLVEVETRVITVERSFADFDDYWSTVLGGPSVGATLATMTPAAIADLQSRLRARLVEAGCAVCIIAPLRNTWTKNRRFRDCPGTSPPLLLRRSSANAHSLGPRLGQAETKNGRPTSGTYRNY